MTADQQIVARIQRHHDAGTLTRELFVDAWREMEAVLGEGEEAEAIESLALFAQDDWMDEVDPPDPDERLEPYLG